MQLPPAIQRAIAFDRDGLAPVDALRPAIGVGALLLAGAATGHPADGAIAAAGALPVGVAALSGSLPTAPVGLLLATTLGMAMSTFVGSLSAGHEWAVYLALAGWGFAAGLLVVLGRAATIVGVQAVVGLLVFGRYPGGVYVAALHAAIVAVGGVTQLLMTTLLRPPRRFGPERLAITDLFNRLAALAVGRAYGGPSGEAIATASTLVLRRAPDNSTLRDLVDESARIRLELQSLKTVEDLPEVEAVTGSAATRLRQLAAAIERGDPAPDETSDLPDAVAAARRVFDEAQRPSRDVVRRRFAAARATALLGQLRAVDRLVSALAGERRIPLPRIAGVRTVIQVTGRVTEDVRLLRETASDRTTPAFRHAVRLAVLLPLAATIGRALPWQRGYWVALTAVVVLKPDYAATVQRGAARVIGTGLGVLLGGLLVGGVHPHGAALAGVVALLAWASYALFAASFAVYSFTLTALVVLLVSTTDPKPLAAVADRGLDTLVGGALALAGYLVWPTPEEPTLRATTAQLLDALASYAEEVLRGYVLPAAHDPGALEERARAARRARTAAEASLDRAQAEPRRLRPDTTIASSVLSAARRIVIALHALRSTLQDTTEHVALAEVEPAAQDLPRALHALAESVRTGAEVPDLALRDRQQRLEALAAADPESLRGRRLGVVAAHLDPLIDSVDTAAHVLDARAHRDRAV